MNNKGTSLIEMLFIVLILAVVAGGIGLGLGLITGKPVDKCAERLKSVLQNNKITTMGKQSAELEVYVDAEGGISVKEIIYNADGTNQVNITRLVEKDVTVTYMVNDDGIDRPLGDSTNPLKLSFDRSSGGFHDLSAMSPLLAGKYCTRIQMSKGSTVKTLKLFSLTGKITLE